ncbi:hypothetical protein BDP27DRAFT_1313658 [Rhodocollybia butyracea]|uniref:Serine/threonine-protein phosphatase 1 regulatory subunit 10 n=1 Tax=Rhodocollybia butyracea TaxID=206335 RepID=A0A9P5UEW6_9AGAR|nr:hypothetical protein BDP27DRAFT_1313658 [Rhodocollybia butyracea]
MEQSNYYTAWLPGQTTSSSSFEDWTKDRPTTSHASTTASTTPGGLDDIFIELGAPASAPATSSTAFPYNQSNYYAPAPYNSMPYGASWSSPPSSSTAVPLSSYSSLNGATSSTVQPAQRPSQSPTQSTMVIDPILASISNPSSQPQRQYSQTSAQASPPQQASPPPQQPSPQAQQQQQPFSYSSLSTLYHPSLLQQYLPQLQQQQQQQQPLHLQHPQPQQAQQLSQGTLSPQALHSPSTYTVPPNSFYSSLPSSAQSQYSLPSSSSTPSASSSQPTPPPPPPGPSPAEKRAQLHATIKPMLQASAFTGAGAVQALAQRLEDFGMLDVDASLRMEVLTKIRDGAGNHYFRAWGENPIALDITREWLKQAYSANPDTALAETTMPLLHIIDRLPLTVESLKTSKLGKLVVKLVKEPSTPAIKDMASNIEREWRKLVDGASRKVIPEDLKSKKRKLEAPSKAPPLSKKPAVGSATSTKPLTVKKEISSTSAKPSTTKDAKSDSSFFSAPKAKPKLPSFKKAPPPAPGISGAGGMGKKDLDNNVAQPSSIDPFQEVLKSMAKGRKGSPAISGANASSTPPPGSSTTPPSTAGTPTLTGNVGLSKLGKKKKSVTWAPDGSLEAIKLIEPAVYDDEPVDGIHLNLRDLHRGEGAALHAHLFEESVDWSEPLSIEIPPDFDHPRGEQSEEKTVQEQREQTALSAMYMTNAHIPDTPAEASNTIPEDDLDKDVPLMTSGPDVDSIFWSSETTPAPPANFVADILSQLAFMNGVGGGMNGVADGMPMTGQGHDMMNLNNVDPLSLRPEQLQTLLQQLNPASANNSYGGSEQTWANPASHYSQFDYSEDNEPAPRWTEGRGRGRGKGRGRGGRGEDGYRHSKRKPCSFFQSGRCKYGDQCDFAHEIIS